MTVSSLLSRTPSSQKRAHTTELESASATPAAFEKLSPVISPPVAITATPEKLISAANMDTGLNLSPSNGTDRSMSIIGQI